MGMQLPEMGGLEATRLVRDSERASGGHVPIIALSASAMPGDRERRLAAAAEFLAGAAPVTPRPGTVTT